MNMADMTLMREELNKMKSDYVNKMREFGKAIFTEACNELFTNNPKLDSFSWSQYTPYFNDGDACEFRVNRDYLHINDFSDFETYSYEEWLKEDYQWKPNPSEFGFETVEELYNVAKGINEILEKFEDDDLLHLFGDHAQVTIYRDGTISTDDYDHD